MSSFLTDVVFCSYIHSGLVDIISKDYIDIQGKQLLLVAYAVKLVEIDWLVFLPVLCMYVFDTLCRVFLTSRC